MNDTDFFIGAAFLEAPDVQDESGLHAYYSRELVIACMQEAIDALVPAPINLPAAKALIRAIGPGYRVIYRDAFRWKDEQGHVLPNHYECFSTETIVEDNNYELLLDLGYAAILVDNRRDHNA